MKEGSKGMRASGTLHCSVFSGKVHSLMKGFFKAILELCGALRIDQLLGGEQLQELSWNLWDFCYARGV